MVSLALKDQAKINRRYAAAFAYAAVRCFGPLDVASNLRPPRSAVLSDTDPHPACGHLSPGKGLEVRYKFDRSLNFFATKAPYTRIFCTTSPPTSVSLKSRP